MRYPVHGGFWTDVFLETLDRCEPASGDDSTAIGMTVLLSAFSGDRSLNCVHYFETMKRKGDRERAAELGMDELTYARLKEHLSASPFCDQWEGCHRVD